MILDIGENSFKVSIASIDGRKVQVKTTVKEKIGARYLDQQVYDFYIEKMKEEHEDVDITKKKNHGELKARILE